MGVLYSGWWNSRCMPRPTKCAFSMEPPQVDPAIATRTGCVTILGVPREQRLGPVEHDRRIAVILGADFQHG